MCDNWLLLPARPQMIRDDAPPIDDPVARRTAIVTDLRARLAPVCQGWPEELFDSMIEGLADITLRYEGKVSPGKYDGLTTDRLVADLTEVLARNEETRNRLK